MARKTRINVNAPKEVVGQINPENKALMKEFLDYLKSIQRSPETIKAYEIDLLGAFSWCVQYNGNKFFVEWTKRQFIKYQSYMIEELGNSPNRVRRVKAALSSLSNFIENILDEEYPDFRNKVKNIESPIIEPVREKTILSDEQIKDLMDKYVEKGRFDYACALALAMYSGRRVAELVQFKVSDFDDNHLILNGALYRSDPIRTKGRGVAGKQLNCYVIAKPFKPYFDKWMEYRNEKGIESEWLFPLRNDPSQHIHKDGLTAWTRTISNDLGVDFYWHSVRHRIVTRFKEMNLPDTAIQQFIGWADTTMVAVYSDLDSDDELAMYFDGDSEDGIKTVERKTLKDLDE